MPWLPEAHERITPEPDRASLLGRIAHHVRVPAIIARRRAEMFDGYRAAAQAEIEQIRREQEATG